MDDQSEHRLSQSLHCSLIHTPPPESGDRDRPPPPARWERGELIGVIATSISQSGDGTREVTSKCLSFSLSLSLRLSLSLSVSTSLSIQLMASMEELRQCRIQQKNIASTIDKLQMCLPGNSHPHTGTAHILAHTRNVSITPIQKLNLFIPQFWRCTANYRSRWRPKGVCVCVCVLMKAE